MFLNMCQNSNVLSAILFFKNIINIISIVVPIILIIVLAVEIFKMVISSSDDIFKNGFKGIIKKTIAAVCVFFVPTLVNLLLSLLGESSYTVSSCWINANSESIAGYRLVEEAERKQEEQKIAEEKAKADAERKAREEIQEEIRKKREEEAKKKEEEANKNNSGSNIGTGEVFPATKYDLTETQLIKIARLCRAEQGSVSGAAAEASLMANLFERKNTTKYGTGGNGLYNYVRTGGWFAHAARNMDNGTYTPEILAAVRDVLVNGNRTLPTKVVEHDCWFCNKGKYCSNGNKGDICKIVTNGVTYTSESAIRNRNNYIKDNTKIYSVYGATYTFYTFPASNSDPFGYFGG